MRGAGAERPGVRDMDAIERILIADGDEGTLRTLSLILGEKGFTLS
jgi:hypothetical protein